MATENKTEKAYLAAGCFWGVEEAFRKMEGVLETRVGYAGGHTENPNYEEVCGGKTGHAETVEIEFDPEKVTFEEILEKFWDIHNPTTINQENSDTDGQYRSVIFYTNDRQKEIAEESKKQKEEVKKFPAQIVTKVVFLNPSSDSNQAVSSKEEFYPAEEYHQKYIAKRNSATCN